MSVLLSSKQMCVKVSGFKVHTTNARLSLKISSYLGVQVYTNSRQGTEELKGSYFAFLYYFVSFENSQGSCL